MFCPPIHLVISGADIAGQSGSEVHLHLHLGATPESTPAPEPERAPWTRSTPAPRSRRGWIAGTVAVAAALVTGYVVGSPGTRDVPVPSSAMAAQPYFPPHRPFILPSPPSINPRAAYEQPSGSQERQALDAPRGTIAPPHATCADPVPLVHPAPPSDNAFGLEN